MMDNVALCVCGCGEQALYAFRHVGVDPRNKITERDFVVENRGHTSDCWIWTQKKNGAYGMVRLGGREMYAHRAMYEQEIGPIPDGMFLDHLCRQGRCIRPAHLEPVTHAENVQRGSTAKLNPKLVTEIRESCGSAITLAEKYGVSESLIYKVRSNDIWKNV